MFPALPSRRLTRTIHWNGEVYTYSPVQANISAEPSLLGWCEMAIDHASLVWAPELTLSIAAPLLDAWPPEENADGDPYPEDALDAWRFRLGVLNALAGQPVEATQIFQTILDNPSSAAKQLD